MNYCLAENPEQCCLQQGGGYSLATLERRHLQKNEQNQAKQKQNYDRHSSQGKEILDIMKLIYARNTLSNIWITGTVLNWPQSIREPKTYLINVRGKVYKRTREHLKLRPTTNITNIPRQEKLSPAPNTDTTQKRRLLRWQLQTKNQTHKKIQQNTQPHQEKDHWHQQYRRVIKITEKFKD